MATPVKYYFGTEAQILALQPGDETWQERAFYYPGDKTYFYQIVNNVLKQYGVGDPSIVGAGIRLNEQVIGGVKSFIEQDDILTIPQYWDYNTVNLTVEGVVELDGQINVL